MENTSTLRNIKEFKLDFKLRLNKKSTMFPLRFSSLILTDTIHNNHQLVSIPTTNTCITNFQHVDNNDVNLSQKGFIRLRATLTQLS